MKYQGILESCEIILWLCSQAVEVDWGERSRRMFWEVGRCLLAMCFKCYSKESEVYPVGNREASLPCFLIRGLT